jgi:hypothetical protein
VRIITTEQPLEDVGRYLRHWANPAYVDEILQGQHLGLTAEKRRKKASDLAATINQALELLHLARSASPLTQPLPLFYAAEAIAKALVIFHQAPVDGDGFAITGLSVISVGGTTSARSAARSADTLKECGDSSHPSRTAIG